MNLSGTPVDYLVAFAGGIVASFTPCVYPLIPVSVGYIGASSSGSKLKGFTLSLVYVTGIAVVYSLLGLLASLTGQIFGAVSAHPATYILAGGAIVIFGISMFGVFSIPSLGMIKPGLSQKKNYFSVFTLGLVSGLVVSPCLTPVVGAILTYLALKKNLIYGTSLLFAFAYGMGLILILSGTFSGILANLPKSGRWMENIKRAGAVVLVGTGIYFIIVGLKRI